MAPKLVQKCVQKLDQKVVRKSQKNVQKMSISGPVLASKIGTGKNIRCPRLAQESPNMDQNGIQKPKKANILNFKKL